MRFDSRPSNRSQAGRWAFKPDSEWDWLALVYFNIDDSTRKTYLIPRSWVLTNSFDRPDGQCGIYRRNTDQLSWFASNFALSDYPPERAGITSAAAPPPPAPMEPAGQALTATEPN